MSYGYFDHQKREYVITDPCTPVKWINYIGSRNFGGFVDHTGGALICKDDPTYNRVTRYVQQMPSSDFKGETLYIRVHTPDGYQILTPFFVPSLQRLDRFECHIGLGYTRILTEMMGLRVDVRIFVPRFDQVEIRDIQITNLNTSSMTFDVIPVVEYSHPNALMQFTNADWIPQTMQSKAVEDGQHLILLQCPFMNKDKQVNFFTSNIPAASFETDRKIFLGNHEYGSYRIPLALLDAQLSNSECYRGDNIAALLHSCDSLEPGAGFRLVTQLGQTTAVNDARETIEKYRRPESVDSSLMELAEFWEDYLSAIQVTTPDEAMNTMLNVHNPYQCYVTKTWSRYLSYYQPGLGSRGIGIRDSAQDVMAVTASVPQEAKAFISTLLSFQKPDGSAMHQFNPLTMEGTNGDAWEMEDRPQYYSDDHLWLVLCVASYLKESGDFSFLEKPIPFYKDNPQGADKETATVVEHLKRALDFTSRNVGRHGLPLLGFADWNDTVNLPAGAESLFTTHLYGRALQEMIHLFDYCADHQAASHYRSVYTMMKNRFEDTAWDGEWYLRYFDEAGMPLGSSRNRYGQIYLNAQSWAVISGFASRNRARQAMDSVYQRLNTSHGIKLSAPGFNGYDEKFGGVTTYPPGAKENGGIFLHPNPWAIMAETMLGNGNRAYEYYSHINPVSKNEKIDEYECEPFVYAQNILGDEHPQFGLARNSWLSGTASWSYQAATQWILGIRPDYGGLVIDPCIPSEWESFKAVRIFRGKKVRLFVQNPGHVSKGPVKMLVNQKETDCGLLDVYDDNQEYHVEVWLG